MVTNDVNFSGGASCGHVNECRNDLPDSAGIIRGDPGSPHDELSDSPESKVLSFDSEMVSGRTPDPHLETI